MSNFSRTFGNQSSPIPLSYLDDNFSQLESASTSTVTLAGAALVGFVQSGTGATAGNVQTELRRSVVTPEQFGAAETYSASVDDRTYLLAAFVAGVAQKKAVLLSRAYQVNSAISLDNSYNNLKLVGFGSEVSKVIKGFSGNLLTLTNTANFESTGVHFYGNHGTYTGKGIVFSGANADYPVFLNCFFEAFTDSHIEYGADSGQYASMNGCMFFPGSGQTDFRAIHVNGPDTAAAHRRLTGCMIPSGYIDLDGAFDFVATGSTFRRIEDDSNCQITISSGCNWGNNGTAMTVNGPSIFFTGNRLAGQVTLASTVGGVFVGNYTTSSDYTVVDNTTGRLLLYHDNPVWETSAVAVTISNTVAEEVAKTIDLPAKLLNANSGWKLTCLWTCTNGADNKVVKVYFGADGAGTGGTLVGSSTQTTTSGIKTVTTVQNRNATNSQRSDSYVANGTTTLISNISSAAIDCTAATEIVISGQKQTGTDSLVLQSYQLELIHG